MLNLMVGKLKMKTMEINLAMKKEFIQMKYRSYKKGGKVIERLGKTNKGQDGAR